MTSDPDAPELVGSVADERLLERDAELPSAIGRPEPLPAGPTRAPIVAAGAALTGVTLIGGIGLIVWAVVAAFSNGVDPLDGLLFALGVVLVATHWGWVHVAEASANAIAAARARAVRVRRAQWLEEIAPYPYHEVATEVEPDGSIAIVGVRYRPVAVAPGRFTLLREIESREVHSDEEPAAAVAERAESLRRRAALATARERSLFLAAAEAHHTAQLREADQQERSLARQAVARALSEQINANLRDSPLEEEADREEDSP